MTFPIRACPLKILAAVAALFAALSAIAQEPAKPVEKLDLDTLIAKARERAPDLAAARHRVAAAEAQLDQALWLPYSKFSASAFFSVIPEKHISTNDDNAVLLGSEGHAADDLGFGANEIGPLVRFKLEGGIPIYTFGKIQGLKDAASAGVKARGADLDRVARDVDLKVVQAYWGLKLAREILFTIAKGRGHLDEAMAEVTRRLDKEEGGVTEIDLIKLKLFKEEVDRRELDARLAEDKSLSALNFLAAGDGSNRVDADDAPIVRVEESLASMDWYRYQAGVNRPELKGIQSLRQALEAKVDLRKAEFYPDILAVGELGMSWAPGVDDIHNPFLYDPYNSQWWAAGLAIKLDLDFGLDAARLDEAKAELLALTADEKRAVEAVFLEVEMAYLDAQKAEKEIEIAKRGKKLAQGWLAAVLQGLAAGVNDTKDLSDALVEFFTMSLAQHKAIYDYNTSLARLRQSTGAE